MTDKPEQAFLDPKTQQAIDPLDYFTNLKNNTHVVTDEFLTKLYSNVEVLLTKSHALGQYKISKKLLYSLEVLDKERALYNLGFRTFVYRDDIEYYMDKVSDKAVKIITLKDFPREIPDEVAEKIITLKKANIFDEFYVVFTDYTGKVEREVQEERKRKDPIIFGAFAKREPRNRVLIDRFYYIADWEDEYCDLTLDKMVSEMALAGKDISKPVCIPDADIESIRLYLNALEEKEESFRFGKPQKQKESIWSKINIFDRKSEN